MTLAWLREAAVAVAAHHLPGEVNSESEDLVQRQTPVKPVSSVKPWRRIDDCGGGLFICGASALEDLPALQKIGVRSILNCGEKDILKRTYTDNTGKTLRERLDGFSLENLEAADVEQQLMSTAWEHGAKFIEARLRAGDAVAVHCQAGVSRSSSTIMAYLITRERMSLDAAFRRVHQARDYIRPNAGFWQQLRELETKELGKAQAQGVKVYAEDPAGLAIARLDCEVDHRKAAQAAGWLS